MAIDLAHDDPEHYLGMPTRHDLCAPVPDGFVPHGRLGLQVLPGGRYLAITHYGPVEFLPFSYMHLAVHAAVRGLHRGPYPPLPYYVRHPSGPPADGASFVTAEIILAGVPLGPAPEQAEG